jgi:hypothetical protein
MAVDTEGLEIKKGRKILFLVRPLYSEDMNFRETLVTELNVIDGFKPGHSLIHIRGRVPYAGEPLT